MIEKLFGQKINEMSNGVYLIQCWDSDASVLISKIIGSVDTDPMLIDHQEVSAPKMAELETVVNAKSKSVIVLATSRKMYGVGYKLQKLYAALWRKIAPDIKKKIIIVHRTREENHPPSAILPYLCQRVISYKYGVVKVLR